MKGFTLIELMVTVAIMAIIAAIAYPSYVQFILRNNESTVQARILELSQALEKHKSQNFSYKGFAISTEEVGSPKKYTLNIVGDVTKDVSGVEMTSSIATSGSGWVIKATPEDSRNATYLMNSQGLKCKNKLSSAVTYLSCGTGAGNEHW